LVIVGTEAASLIVFQSLFIRIVFLIAAAAKKNGIGGKQNEEISSKSRKFIDVTGCGPTGSSDSNGDRVLD
jgi:hypothetical protein